MSLIKGKNISLTYKDATTAALKEISFTVEEGSFTLFLGKSGSGKTTLLKCLAHLITNYSGGIEYQGTCLKKMERTKRIQTLSYVSQHFHLFEHFNVLKNCIHPQVTVLKRGKEEAREKAEKHLKQLGVHELQQKMPHRLSGGQQQRVALARALCMDSKVLLLDEPTSALDPQSTKELQEILLAFRMQGMTVVLITHDMPFVKGLIDTIYFLEEGRIVETFHQNRGPQEKEGKIHRFINH